MTGGPSPPASRTFTQLALFHLFTLLLAPKTPQNTPSHVCPHLRDHHRLARALVALDRVHRVHPAHAPAATPARAAAAARRKELPHEEDGAGWVSARFRSGVVSAREGVGERVVQLGELRLTNVVSCALVYPALLRRRSSPSLFISSVSAVFLAPHNLLLLVTSSSLRTHPATSPNSPFASSPHVGTPDERNSGAFHSPTDAMVSPCTKKLAQSKQRHFTKCVSRSLAASFSLVRQLGAMPITARRVRRSCGQT